MTTAHYINELAAQGVTQLKGVGPKAAERLAHLGIHNVEDLLFHLPHRYQDRTRVVPILELRPEHYVVVEGQIVATSVMPGRRRSLFCQIRDHSGQVGLRFYHFGAQLKNNLAPGRTIRVYGEPRVGATGLEFYHPEFELDDGHDLPPLAPTLTPIYPSTEGLHQKNLRQMMEQALALLRQFPPRDLLPLQQTQLPSLQDALLTLHNPSPNTAIHSLLDGSHPAIARLVLEELVAHQLGALERRAKQREQQAPVFTEQTLYQRLLAGLPFQLTGAQQRVVADIQQDLASGQPMLRLVQGDVGSGKTLVAAAAALSAIEAGYQVALMAPTELLAEQHLQNFLHWLRPLSIPVGWLSGSMKASEKKAVLAQLAAGTLPIVVGTHALFQEAVVYQQLGLLIIDEQHRFGVNQRLALREKGRQHGRTPHQLALTATPIPRTLAMSLYGDLDSSVIDELPPGRQPIQTVVIPNQREQEVAERIRATVLEEGAQAYWVCTLIEESESLQAQAAEDRFTKLQGALPELTIALVHGRLSAEEKAQRMESFARGDAHLLVATTVIEVGVDVPNARLMVIENAERLGLSQLHQLRGRVGRGEGQSYCVLLYQAPLSQTAKQRLGVMRSTTDGFEIAEEDLRLRGPGEWLGTRQTGDLVFRIADLMRDEASIAPARELAATILREQPQDAQALVHRWLKGKQDYAEV